MFGCRAALLFAHTGSSGYHLPFQQQQQQNADEEYAYSGESGESGAEHSDGEFEGDSGRRRKERDGEKLPPLLAKVCG